MKFYLFTESDFKKEMIDHIAPIYRTLIYQFLVPKDISRIGETCRTIYEDENRKKMIIDKISSTFGYQFVYGSYWRNKFHFQSMPQYLLHPIIKEFKKRTLSIEFNRIENLSFEDKRNLVITFPLNLFSFIDIEGQIEITEVLCNQISEMCQYAFNRKMNMGIYDYRCKEEFDLYPFHQFIINILSQIFKESTNKIRVSLMNQLVALEKKTFEIKGPVSRYIFYVNDFLSDLFRGEITELRKMIEIGLFLKKYYPGKVKEYLESCLDDYMDVNDDYENTAYDIHAQKVDEILDEKNELCPNMKNVEVLDRLLLECHLFSASLLRDTNKVRHERYLKCEPR